MSKKVQKEKLFGEIYKELDFIQPIGIMALAKELIKVRKFEQLFRKTKILFIQRNEEIE